MKHIHCNPSVRAAVALSLGLSLAAGSAIGDTYELAAGASEGKSACPRWLSVMPLNEAYAEQLAADVADLGNTTFIDGIAWSCPVNPQGDPVDDRAAFFADLYRKISPLVRSKSSVAQGILLQATMGHRLAPATPTPWQLAVKPDGTSVYRMCPMDERFLEYIAKTCRTFAALKPDFFMIDDDTRLIWPDGVPGCFCPLHLAEFSNGVRQSGVSTGGLADLTGMNILQIQWPDLSGLACCILN